MQLICHQGLKSDPNQAGVEKLCVTLVQESWLQKPRTFLSPADFEADKDLVGVGYIFMAKGWNRSVCALIFLVACHEYPPLLEACMMCQFDVNLLQVLAWLNVQLGFARLCPVMRESIGLSSTKILSALFDCHAPQVLQLCSLHRAGVQLVQDCANQSRTWCNFQLVHFSFVFLRQE